MEEIISRVNNIKKQLDKLENIKKIKQLNEIINNDKTLLDNIEKYNKYKDNKIRNIIIKNEKYREYKHLETEINFLILEINKRLNKINSSKGKCV